MKKLYFMIALATGCAAELEVDSHDFEQIEEEILEPVGVIADDNCQHVDIGDTPCNFRLLDQNGDVWDLYRHEGDIIVLDFSTMWCGPCQIAGHSAQPIQDDYADQGVHFITILIDGYTPAQPPTEEDIEEWVTTHNITTSPVLMGSREKMLDSTAITGYALSGFPTYLYIDRNMKFYSGHSGFSEQYIRDLIEQGL